MNNTIRLTAILIITSLGAAGCGLADFSAYALFGGHKYKVEAEYHGLEGQTIAVIVAGQPGLEFDYPFARANLHMALVQQLGKHVKDSKFVNYNEIEELQNDTLRWISTSMFDMGQAIQADRILYVDLILYTLTADNSVNLLQGQVVADVRVYEIDGPQPEKAVYETEMEIAYPEGAPRLRSGSAERTIELRTIAHFTAALTEKFYDHRKEAK
jgi:hypothetical protein